MTTSTIIDNKVLFTLVNQNFLDVCVIRDRNDLVLWNTQTQIYFNPSEIRFLIEAVKCVVIESDVDNIALENTVDEVVYISLTSDNQEIKLDTVESGYILLDIGLTNEFVENLQKHAF